MNQTNISLPSGEYLFVKLPEGAKRVFPFCDRVNPYLSYFIGNSPRRESTPQGKYIPLGFTDDITEEQAAGIVYNKVCPIECVIAGFENYDGNGLYDSALEYFRSLLTANRIEGNQYALKLKK